MKRTSLLPPPSLPPPLPPPSPLPLLPPTRNGHRRAGKYGAVRQIRLGTAADTRGTAFVVYEDIHDAKAASDHLNGFNVCGRYLVVLYYQVRRPPARSSAA